MIIISDDFEAVKSELIKRYGINSLRFFEDGLVEIKEIGAIVTEAYIAENSTKYIVVYIKALNNKTQNAMLKIVEEPPKNIKIILVCAAKSLLLPTIRSRLPLEVWGQKPAIEYELGLDLASLNLAGILKFIDDLEAKERLNELDKNGLKQIVFAIFKNAMRAGISLNLSDYELAHKLLRLAELNTKAAPLLTGLLLRILHKGRA